VPDLTTKIRSWVSARIAAATTKQLIGGVVAALGVAGGVAWTWVWHHVNPQFEYQASPSSVPSHFVGLGQVLNQIDKDSRVYCTGGLDQRLAEFGLRKCYRFRFEPREAYRMMVCARDERTIGIATTDQLLALRHFEAAFRPLECLKLVPQPGTTEFIVRLGKDATLVRLQFASDTPQSTPFCGCSPSDVGAIARTIGAKAQ
jgi:hypothetical protein